MGKRLTHEEYIQRVAEVNSNIQVLGIYTNNKTKITHKCKICGHEWCVSPLSIINNKTGCPECSLVSRINKRTKTHEQYVKELASVNKNIEVVEKYIGALVKILHRCKIDGYEWYATPASILCGHGCPKCAKMVAIDQNAYVSLLKECNKDIEVIGLYINKKIPIKHRCNIDGYEWDASPSCLLAGHGCPVCSGKLIGNPPEYKNSIWTSEHRQYFSKYMTEEQMKIYTPNSNKKIKIPCIDCGHVKNIRISDLLNYGFCCQKCGDGVSYPNKFGRAFISQLDVDNVVYEYSPEWLTVNGNRCFYDIYFEYNGRPYIVEMDGMLGHGNRTFNNKEIDVDGLVRDIEKDKIASLYNIKVVRIDSKKSNKEHLKGAIMNSQLPNILHFQSEDIDWDECDKIATSKLIFVAANLWESGLSVYNIAKLMHIHHDTVTNYLKKANALGKCTYSKEESFKRAGKQRSGTKNIMARKVIALENEVVYDTLKDAAKNNGVHQSTMIRYCKRHKDFMYYDEWLTIFKSG